jgi:fibronectin type 3 domain-containing protein
MKSKISIAVGAALIACAQSGVGQTIPDPGVMGPALAATVHGNYGSIGVPSSGTMVNAPVVGNGDLGLMIGGAANSLNFVVGKADFWGVQHGVIMPVGKLVLNASALSGSSYSLIENVGAATVTGAFSTGSYGLGLNSWIATSQNTAFIQLTNTGTQPLTFSSQLQDAYGTTGNPATLGYSAASTWLQASPDAVYMELGNHTHIGSTAPLTGRIADLQIFNQALSSAQLNALETPSAVPCLLQWAGTNQGTATLAGTASLNTSDPHGGSVVLTGDANSEVAVGVMGLPQARITVAAWVYLTAVNSGNENCIFAGLVNHGTGSYPFMRGLKLVVNSAGKLSATLNTSGNVSTSPFDPTYSADAINAYTATGSSTLPLNQWVQAAVTYDGNTLTVFTNGTAVGATVFPSATNVLGYNKTAIHAGSGNTNVWFNGCAPQGVLMQSVFGVPVSDNGNTLTFTVPAGGQATIALAAVTDRNTNDFLTAAQLQSQGATPGTMNALYQEHNQWWSNFWSKSFVQIPDQQVQSEWYASLYLLACCSRSNCPPPGLWGNFISSTGMFWEGDYTLDYNYQATFWAALACNHMELADNYDGVLLDHVSRGLSTAQYWGFKGIFLYTHLIPAPGWSDDGYTFWSQKSDAIFAAVNCAMRWRYTQDTNYAAKIYPYMKGVADFWTNYLVLSNNVAYWDYNDAAGESGGTSDVNPATSLAFIQSVFPALNEMSQALNLDAASRPLWTNIIQKLSPLPIVPATSIGSLSALGPNYVGAGMNVIRDTASGTDFPTPAVNVYQDHQLRGSSPGMNSTQVIFPGWDVGLESDPATLAAASNTVYLAAEWFDNNDCCTFYPAAAAVGYNPHAILTNLDALITYHAFPNFMISTPGGGTEDFSVVPCALANMFLQSYQTNLHIFPNWPANQSAAFGNLNACGGFLVSSAITNGLISYVQITSTAGQPLRLANPWPQTTVQVVSSKNGTSQFTGSVYTNPTQVGEVITLTPAGPPVAAPAAPAWLAASVSGGSVVLHWTASTAATGYDVSRSTDGINYTVIASSLGGTTYTDSNLNSGPNYYYEVMARNGFGASPATAPVTASLAPPAPQWQNLIPSAQQIALQWSASPGATGYDLMRSTDGVNYFGIATNLTITGFTDTNVVNGSTYYYVVAAVNGYGEGFVSAPASAIAITQPTKILASSYGSQSGTGLETCSEGGQDLCNIVSGSWAIYTNVNFGLGTMALQARVASATAGGTIEVRLGTTNGPIIGTLTVPNTGGWQIYSTVSTALTNATGIQNVALRFVGGGGYLMNVEWLQFSPITLPQNLLTGAIIGTPGSYNNSGNTISNVFDNNLNTYFDGPNSSNGNGCWMGLDFGPGISNVLTQFNYCPRTGFESRMVGGIFQGANRSDFSDAVTLATISSQPTANVFTPASTTNTSAFRYVRYVSPNGGWGNVAELEFFGFAFARPYVNVASSTASLVLSWPVTSPGYSVQWSTNLAGSGWTTMTSPAAVYVNGQWQVILAPPTNSGALYYRLSR